MRRPTRSRCGRRRNHGGPDLIGRLPDELLSFIISFLPIREAVRTSVISKRWKSLYKYASQLDFDGMNMLKPFSQLGKSTTAFGNFEFDFDIRNRIAFGHFDSDFDIKNQITKQQYGTLVSALLHSHLGQLTSCRFSHFPESLDLGEMENWVEIVVDKYKSLNSLTLECIPLTLFHGSILPTISREVKPNFKSMVFSNLCSLELTQYGLNSLASSAFEGCEKLKTLKLNKIFMEDETVNAILENCLNLEKLSLSQSNGFEKLKIQNPSLNFLELKDLVVQEIHVFVEGLQVMVFCSLMCPTAGLRVFAPNLRSFQSVCNPTPYRFLYDGQGRHILKTNDILEVCSDLFESRMTNNFQNLLTLSIDLNLNNIREALALSFILKSCLYLETLKIVIPEDKCWNSSGSCDDCALPFPKSIFWDRSQKNYDCINHKLKFATIKGFLGKEQEVAFAKHLITRATMMEKISIICGHSGVAEARDLLSLPRASYHLSITLECKRARII